MGLKTFSQKRGLFVVVFKAKTPQTINKFSGNPYKFYECSYSWEQLVRLFLIIKCLFSLIKFNMNIACIFRRKCCHSFQWQLFTGFGHFSKPLFLGYYPDKLNVFLGITCFINASIKRENTRTYSSRWFKLSLWLYISNLFPFLSFFFWVYFCKSSGCGCWCYQSRAKARLHIYGISHTTEIRVIMISTDTVRVWTMLHRCRQDYPGWFSICAADDSLQTFLARYLNECHEGNKSHWFS